MKIEASEEAARFVRGFARLNGTTEAAALDRIIAVVTGGALDAAPGPSPAAARSGEGVRIYADYQGNRTHATFDPTTSAVTVEDGAAAGRYKSPSGAASAVVGGNRNGWAFWVLDDGTRRHLEAVRGQTA